MRTSELSVLSPAKKLTLAAYVLPRQHSPLISEIISRVVAGALLSVAAFFDFTIHSCFIIPTFVYSVGKSLITWRTDFILPWQHLQRVLNAVGPMLLGSLFGAIHPYAGLLMSEETDKHAFAGMISSHSKNVETPCSPIHSLDIVIGIAKKNRFANENGKKIEIFSKEQISSLRGARKIEKQLESLHAQEFIHKITNVTLLVMATIKMSIEDSNLGNFAKGTLVRISGVLIPLLSLVDLVTTVCLQTIFLMTGLVRLVSGRGPIYTEITTNPLMHVSFIIQTILKLVGNLIGTTVWLVSPMTGFKTSLCTTNLFFKLQVKHLMLSIRLKMYFSKNSSRFVVPIVYGQGECTALSFPTHDTHKTYLIVEKKNKNFNMYWVNRPNIESRKNISFKETRLQIEEMINERFPFMNIEKMLNYPVKATAPKLNGVKFATISEQGNCTNCVVSNMFGMIEAFDLINGKDKATATIRNRVVRKALLKKYSLYKNDFNPFVGADEGYSMRGIYESGDNDSPI